MNELISDWPRAIGIYEYMYTTVRVLESRTSYTVPLQQYAVSSYAVLCNVPVSNPICMIISTTACLSAKRSSNVVCTALD